MYMLGLPNGLKSIILDPTPSPISYYFIAHKKGAINISPFYKWTEIWTSLFFFNLNVFNIQLS